jgi:hypothetical protein
MPSTYKLNFSGACRLFLGCAALCLFACKDYSTFDYLETGSNIDVFLDDFPTVSKEVALGR